MQTVDCLQPYAVRVCSELVQANTVNPYAGGPTGNETDGQKIVERELRSLGFTTTLFETPPGIYIRADVLGPNNRSHAGRMNLVGRLKAKEAGKTIVLNGHMDTVGILEMTIPPFAGALKEGRIFGRGACDCKGCLTGGLVAVKALVESGIMERGGGIIFQSVVDEECSGGGAGTIACCLAGHIGDACILLDGYIDVMAVECLGVVTGAITVTGQGGHSSQRETVSALDLACLVKQELDHVRSARLAMHEKTSFCIGTFSAGSAPWNVPRVGQMSFNMSYPFEEAERGERERGTFNGILAREMVVQALQNAQTKHPWLAAHPPSLEWIKDLIPYRTDRNHPLAQKLARAYRMVTGENAPLTIESGWSDAAWLTRIGKMPTVSFGAARAGSPHSADEWVAVADILTQAKVVAIAAATFLEA